MGALNWTNEALAWLADIHDYIAEENPVAAQRIVLGIHDRALILAEFPELGHVYRTRTGRVVRVLIYGHYRIAYQVRADGDIDILGVFHGALPIDRYLK